MLCPECGKENADDATVCSSCGAALVMGPDDDLDPNATPDESPQETDGAQGDADEEAAADADGGDGGDAAETAEASDASDASDATSEPDASEATREPEADGRDGDAGAPAPSEPAVDAAAIEASRQERERARSESWEMGDNAYASAGSSKRPIVAAVLAAALICAGVVAVASPDTVGARSAVVAEAGEGTCTVSFASGNADGGAMTPLVVHVGSSVTVPKCAFIYGKHEFMGWKDSNGKMWQPGTTLVVEGDTTLTATWDNDQCTVTFASPEGPEGHMAERLVVRGARFTAPPCTFVWRGHTFWAWVAPDGSAYKPGDEVVCTGDMTLTSSWDHVEEEEPVEEEVESAPAAPALLPETLPAVWVGSYGGYSDMAPNGVILRAVEVDIFEIDPSGRITGTVNVGVADEFPGMATGSYAFEGAIDWQTGAISLTGTAWTNQGGLQQMGSFAGTIDTATWRITGQWIDPAGQLTPSAWEMTAVLGG